MVTLKNSGGTASATRMWVPGVPGTWADPGVIINGNLVVNGTLGASKISVTSLESLSANLGTVTAGSITGTSTIDITGSARLKGVNSSVSMTDPFQSPSNVTRSVGVLANELTSAQVGLAAYSSNVSGCGLYGSSTATGDSSAGVVGLGKIGVAGFASAAVAGAVGVVGTGNEETGSSGVFGVAGWNTGYGVYAKNYTALGGIYSIALFVEGHQLVQSTQPTIKFNETDQGANLKRWTMTVTGGVLKLQTVNDDDSTSVVDRFSLTRAGAVTVGGQITSTLGIGTAPFSVVSTTTVTNLSAGLLQGLGISASGARWTKVAHIDGAGTIEGGKRIDFHASSGSAIDYGCSIVATGGSTLGTGLFEVYQGNNVAYNLLAGIDAGTPAGGNLTGIAVPTGRGTALKWLKVPVPTALDASGFIYIPYV
jgi:hypothetical protein